MWHGDSAVAAALPLGRVAVEISEGFGENLLAVALWGAPETRAVCLVKQVLCHTYYVVYGLATERHDLDLVNGALEALNI